MYVGKRIGLVSGARAWFWCYWALGDSLVGFLFDGIYGIDGIGLGSVVNPVHHVNPVELSAAASDACGVGVDAALDGIG